MRLHVKKWIEEDIELESNWHFPQSRYFIDGQLEGALRGAEQGSIALYSQRPLFSKECGDLGQERREFEGGTIFKVEDIL
jgi:hypothetical protein